MFESGPTEPSSASGGPDQRVRELERRNTELAAECARYRHLFRGASAALFLLDRRGLIREVNTSAQRLLGLRADDIVGRTLSGFVLAEDRPEFAALVEGREMPGTPRVLRVHHVDGAMTHVDAFHQTGGPDSGPCFMFVDVSERERGAIALQACEARFGEAFDSHPIAFLLTSRDARIVRANGAFCELVGYSPEQLEVMRFVDLTASEHRDAVREAGRELWSSDKARVDLEARCVRKDGARVWIRLIASLVKSFGEGERLARASVVDIDTRKNAQARAANAAELLVQKSAALRELVHQVQRERAKTERRVRANVNRLIVPAVARLRRRADDASAQELAWLERELRQLTAGLADDLPGATELSCRELQVCALIREKLSSARIAETLRISEHSVKVHRRNIRRKLGLTGRGVNLAAFVQEHQRHLSLGADA